MRPKKSPSFTGTCSEHAEAVDTSVVVPAAHNSKTITDNEMKFGEVVENHKLINLVPFNCYMASSLHHNDVITAKFLLINEEKFRDVSDSKI